MLSRELDEAIMLLRDKQPIQLNEQAFNNKLADLLLVCAANGDVLQAVAETVARSIISSHKEGLGKIELRNDETIPWPAKDETNSTRKRLWS